ncbi:vWA domain-containing protein [Microbispora sp. NBRC 16548]|uniref:vWA domain-containing protein n=1 Tax=Microbispora sp. NBRC 16548 TaxID=3030994 RepID=UPI0024A54D9A|nr:vWA domain-containing protein [Microbispora sp. NBRC 16548]GLX06722.1 hypothetical protein Misp03_36490 [Microbispora sp. NBRC 16548]
MSNGKRLVVLVVDRSGSMWDIREDTEGGIRAFLAAQKDAPGETFVSVYQFDDEFETVCEVTPLDEVADYQLVPRGWTALLDAVGKSIALTRSKLDEMGDDKPSEVVFVISTDGVENHSSEYTLDIVKKLVATVQEENGWKMVFIGVGIDAFAAAGSLGISANSTLHSGRGSTRAAYTSASQTVIRSSRGGELAFTHEEREDSK